MSRRPRRGSDRRKRRPSAKHAARAAARRQRRQAARAARRQPARDAGKVGPVVASAREREWLRPSVRPVEPVAEAAVLHVSQPGALSRPTTSSRSIQWDVSACAALCALGAALGVVTVLRELSYHIIPPMRCSAYALTASCAGVVLGLWIPRRVVRRRLARGGGAAAPGSAADRAEPWGLRLEFAASVAGALALVFALTWVALCAGAMLMEDYRAFLVRRFAHPSGLTQLLLCGPILIGLVVSSATGTTLLVALHGWYRLVTQPQTRITRLWASILLGTLVAGLLAAQVDSRALLAGLVPLTVFLAGAVAVLRRCDAVGTPAAPLTRQRATRDESLALLTAGLAAALVAGALMLAISAAAASEGWPPMGVVALAGAAGAGLVAARLLARLRLGGGGGPLILLLASVTLLFPYQYLLAEPRDAALLRIVLVTGSAAACVVLVGLRVERTRHSMQYSLSWVGRAVATGLGLTSPLLSIAAARWSPASGALIVSLVATAGAGLALAFNDVARPVLRIGGMCCAIVWLAGLPAAYRDLARTFPPPAPPVQPVANPLAAAARRVLTADGFRSASVRPLPPATSSANAWQLDLGGAALDLIVLESVPEADRDPAAAGNDDWGQRLLRRLGTRLARGGRLLVEIPTPAGLAEVLVRSDGTPEPAGQNGYRLQLWNETDRYEALVFGRDIPALIERNRRVSEFEFALQPLSATPTGPTLAEQ